MKPFSLTFKCVPGGTVDIVSALLADSPGSIPSVV